MKRILFLAVLTLLCIFGLTSFKEEAPFRTLCSSDMTQNKAYAIELVDGKTYFVTYTRRHETAIHTRVASPTLMGCEEFIEFCAENNLTVVKY